MKISFTKNNIDLNFNVKERLTLIHGVTADGTNFNCAVEPSSHKVNIKVDEITVDTGNLSIVSIANFMRVKEKLEKRARGYRLEDFAKNEE